MRKIRTIAVLPTLFTLGNLVCGFFSIVVASRVERPLTDRIPPSPGRRRRQAFDSNDPTHNIMLSGWLIFLGMIFDALDGHVARLARTSSDFGAELDSLCDVVSFGVAPGFLLVKMCPYLAYYHPEAIWVIAAALPVCAALRLARFNVETPHGRRSFELQRTCRARRRPGRSPALRSCFTRSAATPARCRICSRSIRSWKFGSACSRWRPGR